MDKEIVRFGVVGLGNMGTPNAQKLFDGSITNARLAAICDINPERLDYAKKRFPGVALFESADKLIESGLANAVYIAAPHYSHPEIAVSSMEAGLDVLTEKPAAVYKSDAVRMLQAAENTGRIFSIMYNQRTNPVYQRVRELVRSGEMGEPRRLIWNVTNWFRTQLYFDSCAWRATWIGEGAGVLINQSVHNLDLWQWIFGMPKRLRAFCCEGKFHNIEVEDDITIFGEYENGATAVYITSTGEAPGENRLEISLDRGRIVAKGNKLTVWKSEKSVQEFITASRSGFNCPEFERTEEIIKSCGLEDAHSGIFRNFTESVLWGAPLLAPGKDGVHALEICNAALLSTWTDDWAALPMDCDLYEKLHREKIASSTVVKKSGGKVLDLSGSST